MVSTVPIMVMLFAAHVYQQTNERLHERMGKHCYHLDVGRAGERDGRKIVKL
jgi:hypothetical protein